MVASCRAQADEQSSLDGRRSPRGGDPAPGGYLPRGGPFDTWWRLAMSTQGATGPRFSMTSAIIEVLRARTQYPAWEMSECLTMSIGAWAADTHSPATSICGSTSRHIHAVPNAAATRWNRSLLRSTPGHRERADRGTPVDERLRVCGGDQARLARISHRRSSRGRRDAAVTGGTDRKTAKA